MKDLTEETDICHYVGMQTTLRINDKVYREAKAEAARRGMTITRFIEHALSKMLSDARNGSAISQEEQTERNKTMQSLLESTAHFRIGKRPTRKEMHAR